MQLESLEALVVDALKDRKAQDVHVIDVRGKSSVTDLMIVASGTSDRHVKALAEYVMFKARESGVQPLGMEGIASGDWVLVDLTDVVVHVMLPQTRDFYNLEKLWSLDPSPVRAMAKV